MTGKVTYFLITPIVRIDCAADGAISQVRGRFNRFRFGL